MAALYFSFLLSASFLQMPAAHNPRTPLQFFPDWTTGMVVLETNDTVVCKIRYNQMVPEGLLQVQEDNTILTLSVKDVKCFLFYDAKKKRYRKFFTLSIPMDGGPTRETFLEYVYGNDHVSILNHKTMGLAHDYLEYTPFKQRIPLNKQYLLDSRTGRILPISEENAISLIDEKQKVEGFIESNDIRFRKLSDYVKVFEYAQSL